MGYVSRDNQNFRSLAAFAAKDAINHFIMGSLALLVFSLSITLLRYLIVGDNPGDAPLEEVLNPFGSLAEKLKKSFGERGPGISGFAYIAAVVFLLVLTLTSLGILSYFSLSSLKRLRRTFFLLKRGSDALFARLIAASLAVTLALLAASLVYALYQALKLPSPYSIVEEHGLTRPLLVASITFYLLAIAVAVTWAVQHIHPLGQVTPPAVLLTIFSLAVTWVTLANPDMPISPLGPGGLVVGLVVVGKRLEGALETSYGRARAAEANHVMRNSF
ncbi:hypothetical protein [Aeropyrum camini]|uniref:Uncharacterized protein n=1 Tax=Aeropyrum camini SY1 = JCM 12091 TaxID=1198449 RepID=U3TG29_9CREN|nr:hypothetical protein [Aeropyrum camini]BAN90269.1 hypothetical protein ACAM_0800 [Aeropyrum camini SY1 = JCM 12091]